MKTQCQVLSLISKVLFSVCVRERERERERARYTMNMIMIHISLTYSAGVGKKKLSLNTVAIDNIVTACRMLYEYADELCEHFLPYVEESSNVIVPLVKFAYYEGVRSSAALCVPKLLGSLIKGLKGHNQDATITLLKFSLEPLLEQLKKETDEECRGCLAEAIADSMVGQ